MLLKPDAHGASKAERESGTRQTWCNARSTSKMCSVLCAASSAAAAARIAFATVAQIGGRLAEVGLSRSASTHAGMRGVWRVRVPVGERSRRCAVRSRQGRTLRRRVPELGRVFVGPAFETE